jgi:lycopene beta-cyclase
VLLGTQVEEVTPAEVRLAGGTCIQADAVLDGRGDARTQHLTLGYQKFLGQSLVFEQAHGLNGPILMDATVEQRDGYRFMYTLPLTESSALIEDTRYSDSPLLDCDELRGEIEQYAASKGWRINELEREEQGILPIVISGDIQAFWREGIPEVPRSGLSAALYHPTTGYSLPEAVRLADAVCELDELHSAQLFEYIRSYSVAKWRRDGFFRLLNRMMFLAAEPTQRYRVIKRFYHLPQPLIERFYAGRLTLLDRIRLLTGTPPVPIGRALRALIQSDAASLASVNSQSTRKE